MGLDAPLPWEAETPVGGGPVLWGDEEEARTWAEAMKMQGVG